MHLFISSTETPFHNSLCGGFPCWRKSIKLSLVICWQVSLFKLGPCVSPFGDSTRFSWAPHLGLLKHVSFKAVCTRSAQRFLAVNCESRVFRVNSYFVEDKGLLEHWVYGILGKLGFTRSCPCLSEDACLCGRQALHWPQRPPPVAVCGVLFRRVRPSHGGLRLMSRTWKSGKTLLARVGYNKMITYWEGRGRRRNKAHLVQGNQLLLVLVLTGPAERPRCWGSDVSSQWPAGAWSPSAPARGCFHVWAAGRRLQPETVRLPPRETAGLRGGQLSCIWTFDSRKL